MKRFILALAAIASMLPLGAKAVVGGYIEVDDAGDKFHNQGTANPNQGIAVGAPLVSIAGSIGDLGDTVDAFAFGMATSGAFSAYGGFTDAANGDLYLSLFNALGDQLVGPTVGQIAATLNAGLYILQIATTNQQDPPFSFTLTGPTTAQQGIVVPTVPEPTTLALLGLGLAGVAAMRRKKRPQ